MKLPKLQANVREKRTRSLNIECTGYWNDLRPESTLIMYISNGQFIIYTTKLTNLTVYSWRFMIVRANETKLNGSMQNTAGALTQYNQWFETYFNFMRAHIYLPVFSYSRSQVASIITTMTFTFTTQHFTFSASMLHSLKLACKLLPANSSRKFISNFP